MFEVIGSAYSVAEVGEQLAWLGSALRSSPNPDQVMYCRPHLEKFQVIHHTQNAKALYAAKVSAELSFEISPTTLSAKTNGYCWHDLFRSGVVVEGYPIPRRPETGATSGLEIPLPMMASLAQASYVNTFLDRSIIKGFSNMLVPTEIHDGVVMWHLVHNKNGDRMSYLDSTVVPVEGLMAGQLSQARHILGWCSDAKYLAGFAPKGTRDAVYGVSGSRLPRSLEGGIFHQAFISNGHMITGGEPFLVGYKDTPPHVSRGGYMSKLKWIVRKSAVLWDEETKRGWLLNGASALLHLVRASIVYDCTGPLSSECQFRWETLDEGATNPIHNAQSAIAMLLSRKNRTLLIYESDDEHVTFEDRVKHFINILEQMFDHQIHSVGPDGSGYASKSIPRAHLEGWDFHDLATESDPLQPRMATIGSKGKSWIDFTRSIHAINLLGFGFGEMLEPSGISCPYWASLPKDQYYLAAGMTDLQMALEHTGNLNSNPIRLSDKLVWHKPEMSFKACGCTELTAEHLDLVQVILPDRLSEITERADPIGLSRNGAVVFGYSQRSQWRWGDTGDPERDDVKANEEQFPPCHEDGHGNEATSSNDSENNSNQQWSTQPSSMEITVATSSTDSRSTPPRSRVRSYTKWNLELLSAEDYFVGIVCALPLELLAVRALFDQAHPQLPRSAGDSNHYALGSIGSHRVVAACLPDGEYGTNSAADVASNLKRSFRSVKFCLLVGIGGGVPSSENDIRLGDVVVSKPTGTNPGVIQYDMGKALENGIFEQNGVLQPPPRVVMTAISNLRSDPDAPEAPLQRSIEQIAACKREYRHPGPEKDRLYSSAYPHPLNNATCDSCSVSHVTSRKSRPDNHPRIHYGLIASGNSVMKDARLRDRWSKEKGRSLLRDGSSWYYEHFALSGHQRDM
ncbi:hypothetical protein N7541_005214 [Penicillium brevicompactum]|uniref:Nucleoside phosphorylase domain-containing protein n=1 Tax=Penicillium brevicompactum TaxID=5074 RepID=A0A9W9RDH5_PENBR|nr:hypothetical protein N7541_005214 [Penicillium brevicompactum]